MKVMDNRRSRIVAVLVFLVGVLAVSPFAPARANPSGLCTDAWPQFSVQLVSGDFGVPLWLGFESGVFDGQPGHVGLCYGTAAPGDAKAAGGHTAVTVLPTSNGANVNAYNASDANAANQNNVSATALPTYSLSPGGTGGGQALTVAIPFTFCSGPCQPSTQPLDGQSGVIVGTVSPPRPAPAAPAPPTASRVCA